jgi:hypothetical protein
MERHFQDGATMDPSSMVPDDARCGEQQSGSGSGRQPREPRKPTGC